VLERRSWLNKKIELGKCYDMQKMLNGLRLNTVCQEAVCPNISECFSEKQATFMILGRACTRNCRFCNIEKASPAPIDTEEPNRIAEAVKILGLDYIVITSVTRDDLDDGGAGAFAETILSIRKRANNIKIEVLIPDFQGKKDSIKKVIDARPDIINHNIETVPRLYKDVRPQADYNRSLALLSIVKELSSIYTKSGIMVGLGESAEEILEALSDLKEAGCDFLSIGQYLSPSRNHYPVKEYVAPDTFNYYKEKAQELGFLHVESAPYVRSSYHAAQYLEGVKR
jgi:lipoic acid synthetase